MSIPVRAPQRAASPAARARDLLHRAGIEATVEAAGVGAEIAAVRADVGTLERIAALAPEIRTLGFRYVALDVTPAKE